MVCAEGESVVKCTPAQRGSPHNDKLNIHQVRLLKNAQSFFISSNPPLYADTAEVDSMLGPQFLLFQTHAGRARSM